MREDYFYTEGLTVGYQGVPLIREIAFQLKKGEILTLIGPNGAGKTTILKSLIRQLKPLDGVIVLEGQKTDEMSGRDFARKEMGGRAGDPLQWGQALAHKLGHLPQGAPGDDDLQGSGGNRAIPVYR